MEHTLSNIKKSIQQNSDSKSFWVRFNKLGFKIEESTYPNDKEFTELLNYLNTLKLSTPGSLKVEKMSFDKVKTKTKNVFQKLTKEVSKMVNVLEDEQDRKKNTELLRTYHLLYSLYSTGKITEEQFSENLQKFYLKALKRKNIYDIPVVFDNSQHSMVGLAQKGPLLVPEKNQSQFLEKIGVLFETIHLGGNTNILSAGTYGHELTHCMIDRHRCVIENYFNDEFLSIFMEKVIVDELDHTPNKQAVKTSEIYRLNSMQRNVNNLLKSGISNEEKYDNIKYIQSGIYAGLLFDEYEKADKKGKEAILSEIRLVFSGKKKIKDIIESHNLSLYDAKKYFDKVGEYEKELNPKKGFPSAPSGGENNR